MQFILQSRILGRSKDKSFLYQLTHPYLHLAIKSITLSTFSSLLEVVGTALVLPLTQILAGNHVNPATSSSGFLGKLSSIYLHIPQNHQLQAILISLAFVTIIKNSSLFLSRISQVGFTFRTISRLREICIERFMELGLSFYVKNSTSEMLGYINEQAQRSERYLNDLIDIAREVITITFLLIFLIILSPVLTLITFFCITILAVSIHTLIKKINLQGQKSSNEIENLSNLVSEILNGIRVIKSFNTEGKEIENAKRSINNRFKAEFSSYSLYTAVAPLTETLGILALIIILFVGTNFIFSRNSHGTNLPVLLTFTLTLLRTLPRVNSLNNLRSECSLFRGSFESIQTFLSSTASSSLSNGKLRYQGFQNEILFKNIYFTYSTNPEPTLKNINLSIVKGKTTALVGASGCGKSTLIDLIMRFYDPDNGSIFIDGIDLRDLQIGTWRRSIALVSQDTFLFNCSIRENISYGKEDATDEEILEASRKAYILDFIEELPNGLDTIVGNRGTRLSGGQRQRIAIARAILCNPDILILDEATSSLDSNSEKIVQKAIDEVSQNRTVIVIAHRLSTIENADNIVVMEEGKIVEQGTQEQLLAKRNMFYLLYESQSLNNQEKGNDREILLQ